MITVEQRRFNGVECEPIIRQRSVQEAFHHLAAYELAFGGHIRELDQNKVVVVTSVMGCVDTTTFSGSADEMMTLTQLAAWFVKVQSENESAIRDEAVAVLKRTSGLPFLVANLAPMIVGQYTLRLAILSALGFNDAESLRVGKDMSTSDFVAGIQLAKESGVPLSEIIA